MSSARLHPASPLVRPLILAGLLSLAAITLLDRGTSRMYADPWDICYWAVIVIPALLLGLRLADPNPWKLPGPGWLAWLAGAAGGLMLSACMSPYRGPCLLWTALPVAGLATFLLVHEWLQADPKNRDRLALFLTVAAGLTMVASNGYWLADVAQLSRAEIFSRALFEMRNGHPLGHSNYTAGLALLGLPWLARTAIRQRGVVRLAAIVGAGLAVTALFTSGSRGGLLGLVALGIAALAVQRPNWKRFALWAAVVAVAAGVMAVANPRIRGLLAPPDPALEPNISTVQRRAMLVAGVHMGADRPVLGWGLNTTPLVYPRYRGTLDGGVEDVLQLHGTPWELWTGLGSAGLLLGAALVFLAVRGWKNEPTAAAAFAGYAVFELTDYQLDIPVFVMAMAILGAQLADSAPAAQRPRARGLLAAAALIAIAVIGVAGRPDPTPALNVHALLLARDPAQTAQAVSLLRNSLALNPDQEIAHFNLGWLLLVPDPVAAEQHFRTAAHLVPDKGGVYFGLGLACLNQNRLPDAAEAFALECLNEPRFLASPWWQQPVIAAQRDAARVAFVRQITAIRATLIPGTWVAIQAGLMAGLAPQLGVVSDGAELNYRRERLGYPVLMRNHNIPVPVDLYDVREDPRQAATVSFPLPPKGWLPGPLLLKQLDGGSVARH